MADLFLRVKGIYFEQMRDGTKPDEFRLVNPYWTKRIVGRTYDRVIVTHGYPERSDTEKMLIRPWRGYTVQTITHPHFGDKPVNVFAIKVNAA